jgi:hypothetical protein
LAVIRLCVIWRGGGECCRLFCKAMQTRTSLSPICAACSAVSASLNEFEGSHHIFTRDGVEEILNLQPKGAKSKPYQVKQVRQIIVRYKLAGETNGKAEI